MSLFLLIAVDFALLCSRTHLLPGKWSPDLDQFVRCAGYVNVPATDTPPELVKPFAHFNSPNGLE